MIEEANGKPTVMTLDLVEGDFPLIIGMDIKIYSYTINRGGCLQLCLRDYLTQVSDHSEYTFQKMVKEMTE